MTQTELPPLEILSELGIRGMLTVTPLQGGFDTAMWKVEYEGQSYALRVFRAGGQRDWKREQIALAAAHAAGLPVPEVRIADTWRAHPVLLMNWLVGHTIDKELAAHPWRFWQQGLVFGRMQAAIHAVPAPVQFRKMPDAWIGWQCQEEQTLQEQLRHLASDEAALLHLDYHPSNVLTDGKQVTGIVDWTNALAGDPRADVARTASILRFDPARREPFRERLIHYIFAWAWHVGYQRERGRSKDMPLFYVWAGTILQYDLAKRYQDRPQALNAARRWTYKWKAKAGCFEKDH